MLLFHLHPPQGNCRIPRRGNRVKPVGRISIARWKREEGWERGKGGNVRRAARNRVGTAHPTPLSGMDYRVQAGWQPLSAAKWMGLCRGADSTIHFTLRVQWLPPDASRTTTDRMNSTRGFGQATENHRDHRAPLSCPACLCALGALCGKPHGPRGTAHPTLLQPPLAVIPTEGLGLRCRVACPRSRGHVLKMRRSVRQPMATQVWPCHPTDLQAPPLTVIPTGGPKARSGGIRSNSSSTRHPTPCRSIRFNGVNVDLSTGPRRPPATASGAQRHGATASAVSLRDAEERIPRSAVLRCALHRVARNDDG